MKYCTGYRGTRSRCVAPLVGAWIEIDGTQAGNNCVLVAPLVGAWIEIDAVDTLKMLLKVAPLVGAWIEMYFIYRSKC